MTGAAPCRRPERSMVGEGVLRRDGHLYRGEAAPFGIHLEVHAQLAEDAGGRFFKLQFWFDRLPAHLRIPILDDEAATDGHPPPAEG